MAIEQAPVEINLREPRRPSHDFYALLWLGGWGAAAAIALSALVLTSQTQLQTSACGRSSPSTSPPQSHKCLRAWRSLNPKPGC